MVMASNGNGVEMSFVSDPCMIAKDVFKYPRAAPPSFTVSVANGQNASHVS